MFDYLKYLREDHLPHIWCTGCGMGTILKAILRAVDSLELDKNLIAMVSGIGCSSRTPGYVDFNTLHTTHGRALTFATGLKLARSDLTVLVVSGDGDSVAIGGNHFIHACRRNIDITCIVYNNYIYGMTGGQTSPTTPMDYWTSTAPYGSIEPPFDVSELAIGAGATYVARGTTYHANILDRLIQQGITHKGFSVIEILTQCATMFGRKNRIGDGVAMLRWYKENSIPIKQARKMEPEELKGKITIGVLQDVEKPEYIETYLKVSERIKGG